jgi:excisionase family DNA binding protein
VATSTAIKEIFNAALDDAWRRQAELFERAAREAIAAALKPARDPAAPRAPPLSIQEAQASLGGISRRGVYRLAERGEVEFVRVGNLVRVTAESIERLLTRGYRPRHFPQLKNSKAS